MSKEILVQQTPREDICYGTPVMGGVAYAPVLWARTPALPSPDYETVPEESRPLEKTRFEAAANVVANRLALRARSTVGSSSDLLTVAATFAQDPAWRSHAFAQIDQGVPAIQASSLATAHFAEMFQKKGGLIAQRVVDLQDVCARVVAQLRGDPEPGIPQVDHPVILFADDLAPADTAALETEKVVALVTRLGGPTSHSAVIARQLGIPCVVAALRADEIPEGEAVLVNAYNGAIYRNFDPEEASQWVARDQRYREKVSLWHGPAQLADGTDVQLLANVQDEETMKEAMERGAGGVGLLRTELSFLNSPTEPTLQQQSQLYRTLFGAADGKKMVVRTLDAGSDKPLAWANLVQEEANPALGMRGLRTTGLDQDLLVRQLDAIAEAAADYPGKVEVMAPMVSTTQEAQKFCQLVRSRNLSPGIMVEVPSTAILIEQFLPLVDFVSIGTNDLTQYVMAADRTSAYLAQLTDPWQPAVLKLIASVASAGRKQDVPVGVCGEATSDPLLSCVLLGLGVTSLSAAPSTLAAVGTQLAEVTLSQCRHAALEALQATDPIEARRRVRTALHR